MIIKAWLAGFPLGPYAGEPRREYAEMGQQLLVVNLANLRRGACGLGIFQAYRIDLTGLAIGGGLAVLLVAGFWGFLRFL